MESLSKEGAEAARKESSVADVVRRAPAPGAVIKTRNKLPGTRLGERHGILKIEDRARTDPSDTSPVTRRQEFLRKRRRKRILIGIALVLALFPPMWAVYLIAWLIWRSRRPQKSMRHVRKSVRALEKNQSGVALKHLQEAHLIDPSNNDALYWLGLLLSKQERQEEAEEALSIVAERIPGLPEVESALVDAYVAIGEPDSAIYHAQRLFDAAPHSTDALNKLADAFESAGKIDLAIRALEQAPIHKRSLTDDLVQIHYRLGVLYEVQGDADRALRHFKRVYARDITYRDVRERVETMDAARQG